MREAILDANILLRYLTDEPRPLAERVAAILEVAERQRIALVVAPLTVAEVVYVLESVYHWDRTDIARGLLDLISASVLQVLEHEAVVQALSWYRDMRPLHFADAYMAALAVERGYATVVSFDRALKRVPGITLLEDPDQIRRA